MAIAITGASRLQDLTDVNVTPAVGEDEKVLVYDHDVQRFVLKAAAAGVTDHGLLDAASLLDDDHTQYLLATGGRTGASAAAQAFTVGISLADTTTATTGVVFKGADRFIHNFHHPTGDTEVPLGANTFVGVNAGNFTMGATATLNYHGSFNTAFGSAAFTSNSTGYYCVAIGGSALNKNTTGYANVAVGTSALYNNLTGYKCVAIGDHALYTSTAANNNIAIGDYAMRITTSGYSNLAIGVEALFNNTTGYYNVALGYTALFNNVGGYYNLGIGLASLHANTSGNQNTAIGVAALRSNTTGGNNSAFGFIAGRYHADGTTALTDAENSIYIGYDARGKDNSDSNSIVIGYTAIGLGANTTVIGNTSTTAATIYGAHLANLTDATTNALVPMLTMTKNVTGAGIGAAGLGPVIVFQAESSTTDSVQQARIGALWNDATHATRKADLILSAYDTAEREGLRIRGAGAAAAIGFYGHAPSAQPAAYTPSNVSTDRAFDADTVAVAELADVVGTLIADLQSLGLVA